MKNLEVGQISKIIESPNGFHIIQIYDSRNLNEEKEKKYRVSHIIFKENDVLASEDIINKIKEIKDLYQTILLLLKMLQKNILRMHLQSKVVIWVGCQPKKLFQS